MRLYTGYGSLEIFPSLKFSYKWLSSSRFVIRPGKSPTVAAFDAFETRSSSGLDHESFRIIEWNHLQLYSKIKRIRMLKILLVKKFITKVTQCQSKAFH